VAATQEPATDIELQELEAQTSFVFEVAETQPATHPVAETQEPATGIEIELQESETPDAATQHPVAETQEPATDFEIEIERKLRPLILKLRKLRMPQHNTQWLKHKNQPLILTLRFRNQRLRVLKHYSPYTRRPKHKHQLPFL
jgi:hypothetical protein